MCVRGLSELAQPCGRQLCVVTTRVLSLSPCRVVIPHWYVSGVTTARMSSPDLVTEVFLKMTTFSSVADITVLYCACVCRETLLAVSIRRYWSLLQPSAVTAHKDLTLKRLNSASERAWEQNIVYGRTCYVINKPRSSVGRGRFVFPLHRHAL